MKYCKNEFITYEGILAISPDHDFSNGICWSIFDDLKLIDCGLTDFFAPGLNSKLACLEGLEKLSKEWENRKGFRTKPELLCLESPVTYTRYYGKINPPSFSDTFFLNGMLSERFSPKELLTPTTFQWKKNKPRDILYNEIMSTLGAYSKKVLISSLNNIPRTKHHLLIDAVGLGIYSTTMKTKTAFTKTQNSFAA